MERHEVLDTVTQILLENNAVLACWEGGSTAFGANDAYSDIDLQVLVKEEGVRPVQQAVEAQLQQNPGIAQRFEVPQPSWHGSWQAFYLLQDTSPFHMLDLVIIRESISERFLEPERHGIARVLIDRGGYVQPQSIEPVRHQNRLQQRREVLIASMRVFHWLVDKELARGRSIDAMHFYQSLLVRVVELARMQHCPDRFDFGGRYLMRDLPSSLYTELESLYFVRDLDELREKKARLMRVFEGLVG